MFVILLGRLLIKTVYFQSCFYVSRDCKCCITFTPTLNTPPPLRIHRAALLTHPRRHSWVMSKKMLTCFRSSLLRRLRFIRFLGAGFLSLTSSVNRQTASGLSAHGKVYYNMNRWTVLTFLNHFLINSSIHTIYFTHPLPTYPHPQLLPPSQPSHRYSLFQNSLFMSASYHPSI